MRLFKKLHEVRVQVYAKQESYWTDMDQNYIHVTTFSVDLEY